MSLYREARGRRIWPLAVTALVAGAIGLVVGLLASSGEQEPSVSAAVADLRSELAPADSALELVTIEYPQAVDDGQVVAETELTAASSQAERARSTVAAAEPDLAVLDAAAAERVLRELDELVARIEARADPRAVERLAEDARETLERTVGD